MTGDIQTLVPTVSLAFFSSFLEAFQAAASSRSWRVPSSRRSPLGGVL